MGATLQSASTSVCPSLWCLSNLLEPEHYKTLPYTWALLAMNENAGRDMFVLSICGLLFSAYAVTTISTAFTLHQAFCAIWRMIQSTCMIWTCTGNICKYCHFWILLQHLPVKIGTVHYGKKAMPQECEVADHIVSTQDGLTGLGAGVVNPEDHPQWSTLSTKPPPPKKYSLPNPHHKHVDLCGTFPIQTTQVK